MKKIVSLFLFLGGIVNIQDAAAQTVNTNKELQAFNHLDFGVTLGTTGIGFDFATPICDFAQVRAGFSYMPEIKPTMHFGVQVGDDPTTSQSKFDKMSGMLESFIGHDVDNQIDMIGEPNFYNLSLMVDFFPIKNKNWHVTAGFHYGPSTIAKAYNTTEDMPSLLAVDMYNKMYDFFAEEKYLDEPILGEDNYIDPEIGDAMRDKFIAYGRMGIRLGEYSHDITDEEGNVIHKAGDPYVMVPDENSMAKAKFKVNNFKPYLGFGYNGRLLKNNDRYKIGFDCGAMFWGGEPSVITHDGTDLVKDVDNVRGKVGDYVDVAKKFKVFPVINLRISKRLF